MILLPAVAVSTALIASAVRLLLKLLARKSKRVLAVLKEVYRPSQVLLVLGVTRAAMDFGRDFSWRATVSHVLLLAMIATGAWLANRLLRLVRMTLDRIYERSDDFNARRRQRRTQIMVSYRTACALVWIIAAGIMFLTLPGAKAIGTSLLASAGVAGVVVGFAAQTMLKNFLAGLSLAFGDTIRLGDVVEIETEWGVIEDIALSYVVVKVWDERRLVLPSSYFNDNPFRNWSRESPDVLGTVELDVDWRLPVEPVRDELARVVTSSRHWDGRKFSLSVIEATGPLKRLRPMVSAADGYALWDLRCEVREKLIDFIADNHPDCLPQLRVDNRGSRPESRITAILPVQPVAPDGSGPREND